MSEKKKNDTEDIFEPLVTQIVALFGENRIIPHAWFKQSFGIDQLDMKDYDTTMDFIKANDEQTFQYMSLIKQLTDYMLKKHNMLLRNVWGEGYLIVPADEQTQYGFDKLCEDFKKLSRTCDAIMAHVRPVSSEQAAKDADLRAKANALRMAFKAM